VTVVILAAFESVRDQTMARGAIIFANVRVLPSH
jgi:hypothetical protein